MRLAVGSGGCKRIRTALAQVIAGVVDQGRPLVDAVEAPRLHWDGAQLHAEPGWPDDVVGRPGGPLAGDPVAAARPLLRRRPRRSRAAAAGDPRRGGDAQVRVLNRSAALGRTAYAERSVGYEPEEGVMGLFSRKKAEAHRGHRPPRARAPSQAPSGDRRCPARSAAAAATSTTSIRTARSCSCTARSATRSTRSPRPTSSRRRRPREAFTSDLRLRP